MKLIEVKASDRMVFQHGASPHKEMPDFKPKIKPLIMYKAFKLKLDENGNNLTPGYVYPLYVNTAGEDTNGGGLKIGVWYKSGEGECWLDTKNGKLYTSGDGYDTDGNTIDQLAYRPGWHLTTLPYGNQRGAGKVTKKEPGFKEGTGNNYRFTRNSEVWAKLEICVDIDATERARGMSRQAKYQCLGKLGDDEYYRYRTNANATKDQTWYIVDKIRIIDILDDDTVDNMNDTYYNELSRSTGRKINSDPKDYTSKSPDIPYWKMPRENGRRYSKEDIRNMGYNEAELTHGDWEKNESKQYRKTLIRLTEQDLHNLISECVNEAINNHLDEQNQLAQEIITYLHQFTDSVHVGGSQVEIYVGASSKFAVDKVARKYNGKVKIVFLSNYNQYKIIIL